ncbi:MAG: SWIM zinc finger family protein, partial [Micromonosporaceae bacterium]
YRRGGELPTDLTATIRARVGFPVATADVLAGPAVRDDWAVLGVRDEGDERLTTRRCWLRGARTGRPALVLSFAPLGQPLAADLVPGTTVEADLCFYPGALPLRALVATRHAAPVAFAQPPGVQNLAEALAGYAGAIAAEPWLERWPMLLGDVTPVGHGDRWYVRDPAGAGLPLDLAGGAPWRLVAAAAGRPVTLAGELTTQGLRPVSAWSEGRLVAV